MQKIIERIIEEAVIINTDDAPEESSPGAAYIDFAAGAVYIEEDDPGAFPGNGAAEYYNSAFAVNPDIG